MKYIPLTQGKVAIVDDEDYEYLSQWKWHLSCKGYAERNDYSGPKHRMIMMHRILNKTPAGLWTDHINGDKLDNRKVNLRSATNSQNSINTGIYRTNRSGHKGIFKRYQRKDGSWGYGAQITVNGRKINLGYFDNAELASKARQLAELKYFGEYAKEQ